MNDLITISSATIGTESRQTIDARELHTFLESRQDFSTWIKKRIEDFGFTEGQDFTTCSTEKRTSSGTKHAIDYHVTLDMAKELSMVERNEKGKQARQYFIECERRAKQAAADPSALLNDPAAMRGLLLTYTEKVIDLEIKVSERDKLISNIQPQAEALQRLSLANGSLCITDAAKTLQIQPKKLFAVLQEHKWVYRRTGCNHWVGYQDKLQQQLLEHKTTTVTRTDGSEKITEQVRVTPKGLSKLSLMLNGDAAAA